MTEWATDEGERMACNEQPPVPYCGLILCPSGICSHELKPPQLWENCMTNGLTLKLKSLVSAHPGFAALVQLNTSFTASLWDYY